MSQDFYISHILPHAAIIIKICRAYSNSQEDFEDYYQEVCLQIWRSKDSFKGQCKWSTWVYRVSLNVSLTLLKKNKRKGQVYFTSDVMLDSMAIENEAFENEAVNQLYVAIKQLSEIDRAVILFYLEEKPYQEIASILGTNPNNIGVRVKRIKNRLKKIIDEQFN